MKTMNQKPKTQNLPPLPMRHREVPELVFSPLAWLKLQFFLHADPYEIGGFGISSPDDLLYIEDFITVKQKVTAVTVELDDASVADYVDRCVDQGIAPQRCMRCWCHTHPGASPQPSFTDEQTFARVFGSCDWAIMFILSQTGQTYARLSFNAGPGAAMLLPVSVDWEAWKDVVCDQSGQMELILEKWKDEYGENIFQFDPPVLSAIPSMATAAAPSAVPTSSLNYPSFDQGWEDEDYYGLGDGELALTYEAREVGA